MYSENFGYAKITFVIAREPSFVEVLLFSILGVASEGKIYEKGRWHHTNHICFGHTG